MIPSDLGKKCHRILMFRGGALGDFILTLPAIRALRNARPRVFIELVGRPDIAELALVSGLIENIVSIDSARIASYFVPHAELSSADTAHIRSFDVIISCLNDPDNVVQSNLIQAGARYVLSIAPQVKSGHAIDHWIKPLRQLGVCGNGREMARLDLPARLRAVGKRRLAQMGLEGSVIAIHPGSGSPKKNWPLPGFMSLAAKVEHEKCGQPLFMLGEADEPIVHALKKAKARFPVLSGCTLLETASILSACAGYVGNDSGITHLAAALGIRTVALFGPTDVDVWAPRGAHVSVVAFQEQDKKNVARARVSEVFEKLQKTSAD
ncbi:glycosyltransferase family 9 protein [Verrucomicrobiota bacterium]